MELQAVAIGGLLALGGGLLSALVTLAIQRRQATSALRLHLFMKQVDAYSAVVRRIGELHLAVVKAVAVATLVPHQRKSAFAELDPLWMATLKELNDQSFFMDRRGGTAALDFVDYVRKLSEGELPSAEEVGVVYGRAVDACHRALSIPNLAQQTYREAAANRSRWRLRR